MLLQGKKAIITGGTRGIGYAICQRFLAEGASIALCGSKIENAINAKEKLSKEFPNAKIVAIAPKLDDAESVAKAFSEAVDALGGLDILANNAGLSARDSIFDYKVEDFKKVIDLNVNSVFVCSQAAARLMKDKGGSIINTSSMVSKYGQPSGSAYPASKFAVNGLTLSLARELGKYNIRVNAVAPGVTNTDMMAAVPKEILAGVVSQIPLGRIGEPKEVANAFVFLASDLASYVTGTVLNVDGCGRA